MRRIVTYDVIYSYSEEDDFLNEFVTCKQVLATSPDKVTMDIYAAKMREEHPGAASSIKVVEIVKEVSSDTKDWVEVLCSIFVLEVSREDGVVYIEYENNQPSVTRLLIDRESPIVQILRQEGVEVVATINNPSVENEYCTEPGVMGSTIPSCLRLSKDNCDDFDYAGFMTYQLAEKDERIFNNAFMTNDRNTEFQVWKQEVITEVGKNLRD